MSRPAVARKGAIPKSGKTDVSKASQERLAHALLESAPDAVVVADRYGTIVIVNKQTEQLFGYHKGRTGCGAG